MKIHPTVMYVQEGGMLKWENGTIPVGFQLWKTKNELDYQSISIEGTLFDPFTHGEHIVR